MMNLRHRVTSKVLSTFVYSLITLSTFPACHGGRRELLEVRLAEAAGGSARTPLDAAAEPVKNIDPVGQWLDGNKLTLNTTEYYLKPRKPAQEGDAVWRAVEAAWGVHSRLFPARSEWVRAGIETELHHWAGEPPTHQRFEEATKRLGIRQEMVIVFRIRRGAVEILHETRQPRYKIPRTEAYVQLFQQVAKLDPDLDVTFWACSSDHCPGNKGAEGEKDPFREEFPDIPIFCFQRYTGNTRAALLPEIQMLYSNYYNDMRHNDPVPAARKLKVAFFRGSPTGYGRGYENQRVRLCAGRYMSPEKTIQRSKELAELFNCEVFMPSSLTPSLQKRQKQQLGKVKTRVTSTSVSWTKTLKFKYLLSMDGNGATCSRVFNTLYSDSVLLKLETVLKPKSELFYFAGLRAWQHFVPVQEYTIAPTVQFLRANDGLVGRIARAGTTFAKEEITQAKCVEYTHLLLATYQHLVA